MYVHTGIVIRRTLLLSLRSTHGVLHLPTQVRQEFASAIGGWLHDLPERRDHESRLLPFLLTLTVDTTPAVAATATQQMHQLGVLFEQERREDLKDTLAYLPPQAHGLDWHD